MEYIDNEQESVRKSLSGEKAKLSQMTFDKKIEYIFTYYWPHMLIVLLVLAAVGWFIHHQLTYVDYKLYGVVINSSQVDESIEDTLPAVLGMARHDGVSIVAGLSTDELVNAGTYYNKIDLFTVSDQMDFVFTDEAGVEYLCELGTPLDVTTELPEELYDIWADRVVAFSQRNPNEDTYFDNYAAVDISGTGVQEYFGLDDDMRYLVIVDLSQNEEYMSSFYHLLYEIETRQTEGE